jgi:hypothetical protein
MARRPELQADHAAGRGGLDIDPPDRVVTRSSDAGISEISSV